MTQQQGMPQLGSAVRAALRDERGFDAEEPAPRTAALGATTPAYDVGVARSSDDAVSGPASESDHGSGESIDELVRSALSDVYDPEIGIDVVSLGLFYGCSLGGDGVLDIDMTLTSPYCPLGGIIQGQAHAVCRDLPGVSDVRVNLVWSPPWDPRTMASEEARLELGIY